MCGDVPRCVRAFNLRAIIFFHYFNYRLYRYLIISLMACSKKSFYLPIIELSFVILFIVICPVNRHYFDPFVNYTMTLTISKFFDVELVIKLSNCLL